MKPTLSRELALDALMMAVWRRKPDGEVIVHNDQGSQYGSDDWQRFCRANNLAPSMSRRGNCWDYAVDESLFSSLKKERIRKRIYKTWDLTRADIFDYIEVFYNRARRHSHLGGVSPEAFEQAPSRGQNLSTATGPVQGEWAGRSVVAIDQFFPSSKRCSGCGFTMQKMSLDVRKWHCPECGADHDRDINAAKNIKAAGLAVLACGESVNQRLRLGSAKQESPSFREGSDNVYTKRGTACY